MIDELGSSDLTVLQFLDDLRDIKGYTSILFPFTDEQLAERNRTFFYDGDVIEYQVGTNRLVKAVVDGGRFAVLKDGAEYRGDGARALFRNDRDFKLFKRTCDGQKNAVIQDACAILEVYQLSPVCVWKELQLPQEYAFCTVRELMTFIRSREFEAVQARYMPQKGIKAQSS